MVDAVILAGGLGTRLSQTVPHLPKALAPIQGVPFLHLLLQQLEKGDIVSKIVIALGHKASFIESFFQNHSYSLPIACSIESAPLGTGGAVVHALRQTEKEILLILNGDSYFDLNLPSFLAFHKEKKAAISLACKEVDDASRYGNIEFDLKNRVSSFQEKKSLPQKGWISGGIYLIQKELLSPFSSGSYSIERDFFPRFLEKGIFAYPCSGTFIDIGVPASYFEAQGVLKPWISQ